MEYAFGLYDSDNNGSLTRTEMEEVLVCMLDLMGADKKVDVKALANEIINILDTNRDGQVSKTEFIQGISKNFSLR